VEMLTTTKMKELSRQAKDFLTNRKRESKGLTQEQIENVFVENGLSLYEALVRFELDYNGYVFYLGLEPIQFHLIQGGGMPFNAKLATIEFDHSELDDHQYDFDCAHTQYGMTFTLDENGVYYEDYQKVHSCFDYLIEELAIWDNLKGIPNWDIVFRDIEVDKCDGLVPLWGEIIENASDQYTQWYCNGSFYIRRRGNCLTLIGNTNDKLVKEMKIEVANQVARRQPNSL